MFSSTGVAPILPTYSSGILPKHVFPGAIHRIKRYSYHPIIPGLSLLTGANGSSAAEKPPKYENIWETWLLSYLPLSRLCEIIQDVYAACIYWIRCQWLFILVYRLGLGLGQDLFSINKYTENRHIQLILINTQNHRWPDSLDLRVGRPLLRSCLTACVGATLRRERGR